MHTPTPPSARPQRGTPWSDRLTLLLESTGEGIFGVDTDGRCRFINRAGARLIGLRPDEVIGRNMHDLIHHSHGDGSRYPVAECPIFAAFRQGVACRIDSEVLWRADGSAFAAEYSSHPIVEDGRVLGAVVTFVDISERKDAEDALLRANEELELRVAERTRALTGALAQLRELSAHLESVREDERTRIAREIHDELGSLLVALKMDVGWLGKRLDGHPQLQCKCRSMGRLIERAVDNVGRIITDLRPSILDHQGVWAALEWHAQEFAETSELACSVSMRIDERAPTPPEPQALAIFRIFQEMLSNVARHARARSVRIEVDAGPAALALAVHDDGRGAPPGVLNSPGSYGVLGMRERALHFGGSLDLSSAPGEGTRVRLHMPLSGGGE